ncbi:MULTISPECIES: CitMHS family transporter [unclassified Corynebacterium]|uniref:CitMHS family transporter n=1 Tax=unclassified Corynebacterium TaxID=2624378 RepID=UPI0029CA320D|nr:MULTISPECIES: SLC13 family permease [unclassified Corynebacterium]WPF66210.1 SLC13 family permease [Corynebacterium sp. 22KM0430]WPF68701.1 SLC13 family permease [Corynebacterium sp. 21KM1197]
MHSPLGLTLAGLAIIALTVGLLIRGKTSPVVAMTLVPAAGALLMGYSLGEIGEFFGTGLDSVMNVVVMFIFAIIYFGILQDIGLFNPVVTALIRATRGNVVLVTLGTAAIGTVAHLDGAGATTFLLTIPALLPLYQAMHMSRYVLLTIVALAASVMNMVPWAGPVGRTSSVIELAPTEIWHHLLPMQGVALALVFVIALLLGLSERRRIARLRESSEFVGRGEVDVHAIAQEFVERQQAERAKQGYHVREARWARIATAIISVALLVVLVSGWLEPGPAFLIATTIILPLNFDSPSEQTDAMKRHAPSALAMASVIIAAAMFLGVLGGAGMLEQIALSLLAVLPAAVGPWVHVIVGYLGVPLDMATSTDAYYFSVLPIVQETAGSFGVSAVGAASALIIGNVIGTFVSPFSPALWLAIGLARADMGRYLRLGFPLAWGLSITMVTIALLTGLLA